MNLFAKNPGDTVHTFGTLSVQSGNVVKKTSPFDKAMKAIGKILSTQTAHVNQNPSVTVMNASSSLSSAAKEITDSSKLKELVGEIDKAFQVARKSVGSATADRIRAVSVESRIRM